MADMRITPFDGLLGSSNSSPVNFEGLADGTAFTESWLLKQALKGRVITVNAGTGTAPITSAGAYANTTPDVDIKVPAGVLAIPVSVQIGIEAYGTTLLFEAVAAIGSGGVFTPTSADAVTVKNMRTDIATSTLGVTAVSTGTGATYMDDAIEFMRHQHNKMVTIATADDDSSIGPSQYSWSALQSGVWPIMYNPGNFTRMNVFMSGQATTGFVIVTLVVPEL
jgi:hypothetical protein